MSARTGSARPTGEDGTSGGGLTACLWFDGRAEEAAHDYTAVVPDSALGSVVRRSEAGPGPTGEVMVVDVTIKGEKVVALNGGPQFSFSEAVSFQIHCDDQDEVDYSWDRLTAGGGAEGPCGWLKDKYGLSWQAVPKVLLEMMGDPDGARVERVSQALFTMKRLRIAELEKAFNG